ncbi:T9SS type A sorting domain-containing protein [bacterium]|nr:T9SS type A sorting domain-containing protein [bacterium]
MNRFLQITLLALFCYSFLNAQETGRYEAWKSSMNEPNSSKSVISVHNDYVRVQLDDADGQFNIGTYPDDRALMYQYPFRPWSSWTIINIDGVYFTQDPTNGHGAESSRPNTMGITNSFRIYSHSGDSSFIEGTWRLAGILEVTQRLQPVYLTNPRDTTGTIMIRYTMVNIDSRSRQVGLLLQLDTMVGANDGAPLATQGRYSGLEDDFWGPDSIPFYWHAYESALGPAGPEDQLIAMGILAGLEATPPDRFAIGAWPHFWPVVWDYTISPGYYFDSSVLMWWFPVSIAPGDSLVITTYYGLGLLYSAQDVDLTLPLSIIVEDPCNYEAVPFFASLWVGNSGIFELDDAQAEITLPDGLELVSGETYLHDLVPGEVPAGGVGTTSWELYADGSISDTVFTVIVEVTYSVLGSLVVKSVEGDISMPATGLRPEASLISPISGTRSACPFQEILLNIQSPIALEHHSLEFMVNGVFYGLSDPELEYIEPTLTFTPGSPFRDEEIVYYALTYAADSSGCPLNDTLESSFQMDLSGPIAYGEFPPEGSLLGYPELPEMTINIEDNLTPVDASTIIFEVNRIVYNVSNPALNWDGGTLHFYPSVAGMEFSEYDTVFACLLAAADMPPDFCEQNPLQEPFCWSIHFEMLSMYLPEREGHLGDTVLIPIFTEELTQFEITRLEFTISADEEVLIPLGINSAGTITEPWASSLSYSVSGGDITISGNGTELTGDSELLYIRYLVNPDGIQGSFTRLDFRDVEIDGGSVIAYTREGFFLVLWDLMEWLVPLKVEATEAEYPVFLHFGVSRFGDETFNPGLDQSIVPSGQKLKAYFPMADFIYPYFQKLQRDIKSAHDYSLSWEIEIDVEPDTSIWSVWWNTGDIPEGRMTIQYADGPIIDMHTDTTISAMDDANLFIHYRHLEVFTRELLFKPGWHLISFPLLPRNDLTFAELLPGMLFDVYWYDPEAGIYRIELYPEAGKGYWLYALDTIQTRYAGVPVEEYSMHLYPGWNMIGVPYTFEDSIPCTGTYYWFDNAGGNYELASSYLQVGLGYWMFSESEGDFHATGWSVPGRALFRTGRPEILIPIIAESGFIQDSCYIGWDDKGISGRDNLDRILPPSPPFKYYSIWLEEPNSDANLIYVRDIKQTAASMSWILRVNQETNLKWDPGDFPEGFDFIVTDGDQTCDMRVVSCLSSSCNARWAITVRCILPDRVELLGNYPNPFNSQTFISFALPQPAEVKLEIFDIQGKLVRSTKTEFWQAGIHNIHWDGQNSSGQPMSSGIYLYRLWIGGNEYTHKMILVK